MHVDQTFQFVSGVDARNVNLCPLERGKSRVCSCVFGLDGTNGVHVLYIHDVCVSKTISNCFGFCCSFACRTPIKRNQLIFHVRNETVKLVANNNSTELNAWTMHADVDSVGPIMGEKHTAYLIEFPPFPHLPVRTHTSCTMFTYEEWNQITLLCLCYFSRNHFSFYEIVLINSCHTSSTFEMLCY